VIAWVFRRLHRRDADRIGRTPRSRSRKRGAARIGVLAEFGIVAGILSVVMLRACFGVFSGHVVALSAIAALTIFASGAANGRHPGRGRPGRGPGSSSSAS